MSFLVIDAFLMIFGVPLLMIKQGNNGKRDEGMS